MQTRKLHSSKKAKAKEGSHNHNHNNNKRNREQVRSGIPVFQLIGNRKERTVAVGGGSWFGKLGLGKGVIRTAIAEFFLIIIYPYSQSQIATTTNGTFFEKYFI